MTNHRNKKNEDHWNTLFNSMTEMVVLHELVFNDNDEVVNYRITDCNKSYSQITGIIREEAIGKLATEVYQTKTAPYLEEFTNVGITGESYEYSTYYAPMNKYFLISVVSPGKNEFATITTDVTAIKEIEHVVSAKNKELENYLYVASHDLRSPLVNIQGFSQILKEKTDSIYKDISDADMNEELKQNISTICVEDIPKTLEFIYTSVSKMDNLIKGLLQISRTGRVVMTVQETEMNQLIQKVLDTNSFQIDELGVDINVEHLPSCYGDQELLNQLFSNIITNAITYRNSKRSLIITITGKVVYSKVIYSIEDNGLGISPRHLKKIWDVFYQINPKISKNGDGIGLSIVKRIIDKHKGKVWVESAEGEGSTFHIELPKTTFSE